MKHIKGFEFGDRQQTAADAKKALLAKFQPKTATATVDIEAVKAAREAERERVRQERAAAKEAARLAKIAAEEAKQAAAVDAEQAGVDAKRQDRKDRKALLKLEAQKKREANQAVRAERRGSRTDDQGVGW
jgi:hypothetical protein